MIDNKTYMHTEKLGLCGLGSLMEKPQYLEAQHIHYIQLNGEVLHTTEEGLLHTNKQEGRVIMYNLTRKQVQPVLVGAVSIRKQSSDHKHLRGGRAQQTFSTHSVSIQTKRRLSIPLSLTQRRLFHHGIETLGSLTCQQHTLTQDFIYSGLPLTPSVAQWIKGFIHKHEDLSLHPQNPCKARCGNTHMQSQHCCVEMGG